MPKLYIGNLAVGVTEKELQDAFASYGKVSDVNIIKDRETGQSRGFAFVEMPDAQHAKQAIEGLNLERFQGRSITVNEARPRDSRGGGRRY